MLLQSFAKLLINTINVFFNYFCHNLNWILKHDGFSINKKINFYLRNLFLLNTKIIM